MKIIVTSIFVEDQERALRFYTDVLGFIIKEDVPVGDYRWVTVVSPEDPHQVELLLEPNVNPAAKQYQSSVYAQGIPATVFGTSDINAEFERLRDRGVSFKTAPVQAGPVKIAVFEDTCGNLIQLVEK